MSWDLSVLVLSVELSCRVLTRVDRTEADREAKFGTASRDLEGAAETGSRGRGPSQRTESTEDGTRGSPTTTAAMAGLERLQPGEDPDRPIHVVFVGAGAVGCFYASRLHHVIQAVQHQAVLVLSPR